MYITYCYLFFFNDTATTEIYTLSLHDALPICAEFRFPQRRRIPLPDSRARRQRLSLLFDLDRKSTRLNSSHSQISYAVFCLKKKSIPPLNSNVRMLLVTRR